MSAPREVVHAPCRELAPFVETIRWSAAVETGTYPLQHLPDGRALLHFRLAEEGRGTLSVAGPRLHARSKLAHQVPLSVRVVFRAGCAAPFLGAPPHAIVDALTPLSQLWGAAATELEERLVAAREPGLVIAMLESGLVARRRASDAFEPATARLARRAARLLAARVGPGARLRMADLAAELGVSERHLRRAFVDTVGLAPKQYARVARLHRVLDAEGDWSLRARLAGYYDQAHLIGEFRALMGVTPEAHARGRGPARRVCGS